MTRFACRLSWAFVVCFSVSISGTWAAQPPPEGVDNVVYGDTPLTVQFNSPSMGLGGVLSYHWDFGDGQSADDPAPVHTYTVANQYTAGLTVSSDDGTSATRTVIIYANGQAAPGYPLGDVNKDCTVNVLDLITVRNHLNESGQGTPFDLNGDGWVNVLDMIAVRNDFGQTCETSASPQVASAAPPLVNGDWAYQDVWEEIGITTPKSDDGPYAQRAQVWDIGETIQFTFAGAVGQPEGTDLGWTCAVRSYWGDLLHAASGTLTVGPGGAVQASAGWTADYLGTIKVIFECAAARGSMYMAVIKPMGAMWNDTANPFGGMAQHPAYDEYEPYLDLQKRIGMKTLRVPIGTESVARDAADLNTALLDKIIDPLNARGFRAYLLPAYFPNWMKEDGVWKAEWADIDARIDWFADYIGRLAGYCKTKGIRHYEVWNEPNLGHFWGWGELKYCELLGKAYTAAKAADPNCVVISGGMPGIPGAFNSTIGQQLIDGPYANSYDILAGHYYRTWGGYSPEHPTQNMFDGIKEAAARASITGKPTWDTESDYGYFFKSEWESMNWYTRQMAYMLAGGVEQITVYAFASAKEKLGYTSTWWHNFFGMIANSQAPTFTYDNWPTKSDYKNSIDCFAYTPLPRYPAFSTAVHELAGAANWTETSLPDGNVALVYQKGPDVRAMCWRGHDERFASAADAFRGLQIALTPVAMRDVFGNPVASAVIPLGPSPVYVDFGTGVSVGQVKAALEAGAAVASPGTAAGSFNLDFMAVKLFRKTTGMPQKWHVLAPISDVAMGSYNAELPAELAIAVEGGARMAGTDYTWTSTAASIEANSSKIDLQTILAPDNQNKTTILYAVFNSPTARRGRVHYGASEDVRIWVNGEEVADRPPTGPYQPNRYSAPGHPDGLGIMWETKPGLMDIKPGRNVVVVKIHARTGAFGLHFRIAWENFETMTDLTWEP
ncbi:MAG: PKD domain-containing protein [Planctomycetes bacterium]|nr:PKD domain-containing protein [Planctomycetota bacterium]